MNRFSWSATAGLLTISVLSIGTLILELAAAELGATLGDFATPKSTMSSLAISWICLCTLGLVSLLRPWNLDLSNYDARVGMCMVGWIVSAALVLTVTIHAPPEMRVLAVWHGTVLGILLVMLLEGMVRVALSKRRLVAPATVVFAPPSLVGGGARVNARGRAHVGPASFR